ncbi:hypothetical protein [Candidatus Amarolinea dominans]|uniref:hypothetical protein n=1 Tax=Candidatus Amarolinea dominans TaxID=3140696 RepID=UPI0031CCCEFC
MASELGVTTGAIVLGSGVDAAAAAAISYGADTVYVCDDPSLKSFRLNPYTEVIKKVIGEVKPTIVLFPASGRGPRPERCSGLRSEHRRCGRRARSGAA